MLGYMRVRSLTLWLPELSGITVLVRHILCCLFIVLSVSFIFGFQYVIYGYLFLFGSFLQFSVMLGYNNLDGLVNGTQKEAGFVLEDKIDTFDVSSICKKFPSISIGSSPVVELYTDSACHSQTRTCSPASSSEEIQPLLTNGKWIIPEYLTEKCPTLDSRLPNTSSLSEKASLHSPDRSQPDGLEEASLPLDKPISSIKGLSKRHSTQLEDCDFHTVGIFKLFYR